MSERPDPTNAVEFIDGIGQRWAWSESNVQYERVDLDSDSYTLMRQRLTETQELMEAYRETAGRLLTERDAARSLLSQHPERVRAALALMEAMERLVAFVHARPEHSLTIERGVWHGDDDPPADHDYRRWLVDVEKETPPLGVIWDEPGTGDSLVAAIAAALAEDRT